MKTPAQVVALVAAAGMALAGVKDAEARYVGAKADARAQRVVEPSGTPNAGKS